MERALTARRITRPALGLAVLTLAALACLLVAPRAVASELAEGVLGDQSSPPPGNNGTVKIHDGAEEPDPVTRNQPHVCTFHIHAANFDPGQVLTFEVRSWPPTGDRTVVLEGTITTDDSGEGRSPVTGAHSLPDGHYKLFVDTGDGRPTRDKHKVFWVDCPPANTTTTTTTTMGSTTTTTTTGGSTTTTSKATSTSTGGATSSTGASTSTSPGDTGTSAAGLSTSGPAAADGSLPFTGSGRAMPLLLAALLLLGIGAAAVVASRRRTAGS